MRRLVAMTLLAACLGFGPGAGAAHAFDGCGPGCHSAVNGECVVNGWESGARVRNECPAGAHASPPCAPNYTWSRRARACLLIN
jgi:hypothetical protein